jgi:antirestriction protein
MELDLDELAAELDNLGGEFNELDDEDRARLVALLDLADTLGGDLRNANTLYGTLIADDDFVAYAQDFAEELGAVDDSARWPATCIDWDQAAAELQSDYTSVDFDGTTYYYR